MARRIFCPGCDGLGIRAFRVYRRDCHSDRRRRQAVDADALLLALDGQHAQIVGGRRVSARRRAPGGAALAPAP